MEQVTQTGGAGTNNAFPSSETPKSSGSTLVIGVIVLLALIAGGWFMMNQNASPAGTPTETPTVATTETMPSAAADEAAVKVLSTQSDSDEVAAIDADLKATDLNAIGDPSKI